MRILITGAGGWIGSNTATACRARGHEVISTGDKKTDIELDVTDRWKVFNVITEYMPEVVINLAGRLGTEELQGLEALAVDVNVSGALNVYDAAVSAGARVVQIGTGHKGQSNTYALTKALAEDLALMRAHVFREPITIVRAYHAYGPGQAYGQGHVRKIIPSFVTRALLGQPIEIFGTGQNIIDLVPVTDVALVLTVAAENGKPGEIVEAGTGVPRTVDDVAKDIIGYCNSTSEIVRLGPRSGEPVGAKVIATQPVCENVWPYLLPETIDYYARKAGTL